MSEKSQTTEKSSIEHICNCKECREYMNEMISIGQFRTVIMPMLEELLDKKLGTQKNMQIKIETLHSNHWPIVVFGLTIYLKNLIDFIVYIILGVLIYKNFK